MDPFKNERKAESLLRRAETLLDEQKYAAAGRLCRKAVSLAPALEVAHNLLGYSQAQLGDLDDAIGSFRTAIRLSPRYFEARENLRNARLEKERITYRDMYYDTHDKIPGFDIEDSIYGVGDLPGYYYLGWDAYAFKGYPGHRNLPGKSGFDPMDTYLEQGFMEGVILKRLLMEPMLKNPVYWICGAILAILLVSPVFIGLWVFLRGYARSGFAILLGSLTYTVPGFILLNNVRISLPPFFLDNHPGRRRPSSASPVHRRR